MRIWLLGPALIGLTTTACVSLQSKTAGSIGCPPDEVEISDQDSSHGWGSSAETWVASCRGKRFICSENTVTAGDGKSTSISRGLACTEEIEQSPANGGNGVGTSPTGGDAAAEGVAKRKVPDIEPPTSVAGFEFGADIAAIQQACEGAGKTWSSSRPKVGTCSGPALDVGFDVKVRVDFCHEQTCAVTLVHRPDANWISAFSGIKDKLTEKYNSAAWHTAAIPSGCRQEDQVIHPAPVQFQSNHRFC